MILDVDMGKWMAADMVAEVEAFMAAEVEAGTTVIELTVNLECPPEAAEIPVGWLTAKINLITDLVVVLARA